jgi:hypothetical protein
MRRFPETHEGIFVIDIRCFDRHRFYMVELRNEAAYAGLE